MNPKRFRFLLSRLLKNYSQSTAVYVTKKHARSGRSAEPYIQLLVAGGTGAKRPSAARHPGHGGRGADPVVGAVGRDVRQRGAAVDCAGEVVASAAAADAVLGRPQFRRCKSGAEVC